MNPMRFAIAALVLGGCAAYSGYGLRPGASTQSQIVQTMGRPALQLPEAGGGRELFYPRGPLGTQTFVAHVGPDGVLRAMDQVLDDDHFRSIQEGMTRDQVLAMIGPPAETMRFQWGNYAWTYRFVDTWGYTSDFSVTFNAQGIVVSKIAIRVDPVHDLR